MSKPINVQQSLLPGAAQAYFKNQSVVSYQEKDPKQGGPSSQSAIKNIAWNSTGTRIAVAYSDARIRVWIAGKTEVNTSTEIPYSSSKAQKQVTGLAWSPVSPDQLTSCSSDGSLKVWDTKTKTLLASVGTGTDALGCWWSPCGKYISVLRRDNVLLWYNAPSFSGEVIEPQTPAVAQGGRQNGGRDSQRSRGAPKIAVGATEAFGNPIAAHKEAPYEIFSATWTNTTSVMAITLGIGVVKLLKLNLQTPAALEEVAKVTTSLQPANTPNVSTLFELLGHTTAANCVKPDPQGRYIAVGGNEGIVSLWDTKELVCVKTLSKHDQPVVSLDFSHDGDYIAVGYESTEIPVDIVHVDTGEFVHAVSRPRWIGAPVVKWSPVKYNLAFSGDVTGLKVITVGGSRPSGY
ncbi:THO complex subunit 3 [Yarrowia sp. C11]|nr:THO complex subunit 3 [Yarrowia sp. C11]KAG5370621.1 THO complex subunit 3 [Yarrowia sp. E02]